MALTNSDWDDIPSSSELFGGDFFGDELMEMYTADHGLNLGENSASIITTMSAAAGYDDVNKHPGILMAMNAAAMDGGLGPLGASLGFAPLPDPTPHMGETSFPSFLSPPSEAIVTTMTQPTQLPPPPPPNSTAPYVKSSKAPKTSTAGLGASAKRPAAVDARAQGPPSKRQKGAAQPSAAPRGKATGLSRSNSTSTVTKTAKALSPAAVATTAGSVKNQAGGISLDKSVILPKDKISVRGGIAHQVLARSFTAPSLASVVASTATANAASDVNQPRNQKVPTTFSNSTAAVADEKSILREAKTSVGAVETSSTGLKPAVTEADFKDVASAAVTCLIQNASSASSLSSMMKPTVKSNEKIDTSTAHITALTSQSWVTACNPTSCPDSPPSSSSCSVLDKNATIISTTASNTNASNCDKAARNARRASLSQDERAKQNRDRNREHARNTRLRKKAYVEELKRTLTEMVSQRDAADLEKRHEAQRNREQREVRFRVLEEFLNLRGRNETNTARWVAILEDGFTFTLPRTTFRRMVNGEKSWSPSNNDDRGSKPAFSNHGGCSTEQVIRGAASVMEDSSHLSTFLQSMDGLFSSMVSSADVPQVQIVYKCDRKRFFMDGNVTFMDFTANTLGVVTKGGPNEVIIKGSISAVFSPASNKLISIDMIFDCASIHHQMEAIRNAVVSSVNDAAANAAHEAGALLDSIQMPQIYVEKTIVSEEVTATGPVSVSSDDGDRSTNSSNSSAAPIIKA